MKRNLQKLNVFGARNSWLKSCQTWTKFVRSQCRFLCALVNYEVYMWKYDNNRWWFLVKFCVPSQFQNRDGQWTTPLQAQGRSTKARSISINVAQLSRSKQNHLRSYRGGQRRYDLNSFDTTHKFVVHQGPELQSLYRRVFRTQLQPNRSQEASGRHPKRSNRTSCGGPQKQAGVLCGPHLMDHRRKWVRSLHE
jgi:hypothetical protein